MSADQNATSGDGYPQEWLAEDEEIRLVDFLYPLFKRRWLILLILLVAVGLAGLFTFLSPRIYEARAVIMPETGETAVTSMQSAIAQQFGISLPGQQTSPSVTFSNVLTSRPFAERVAERLNLAELVVPPSEESGVIPAARLRQAAAEHLLEVVKVNVDTRKGETITITVQETDPVLATHIANTYVQELDRYNQESNITKARRLRLFLEERLAQANQELIRAQKELRTFQEQHKAISIAEQAKQTLTTLAELEAKKLDLEVELAAREQFVRESHSQIKALQAQIAAIQKNIEQLKYGDVKAQATKQDGTLEYYLPLDQVPLLSFQEKRLLLEVETKSKLVEFLTTQLEQVKLDEARELPTITVLEQAVVPEEPVKPKTKLILVLAMVVGLFGGIMVAFIVTYFEQETRDAEQGSKWEEMRQGLREDVWRVVRLGKGYLWIGLFLLLTTCDKLPWWGVTPPLEPVNLSVSLLAAGYEKGIYRSSDGGLSWSLLPLEDSDISYYFKTLTLRLSPTPTIYIGTTGQGMYQVPLERTRGSMTLHRLQGINVRAILFHPTDSEVLYAATWGQGVLRSRDGGQSWEEWNQGLPYLHVRTLAVTPTTPPVLYAGTIGGIFRRQEGQAHWEARSKGLLVLDVKTLAIDPQNPQVLYAGTGAHVEWGSLYRSTDGGESWTAVADGPSGVTVFTILLVPGEPEVWLGTSRGVMRSSNGIEWEDWSAGLPGAPVYSLVLVQKPSRALFAATHGGVYRRLMKEESWLPLSYGLEGELVTALIPAP